MPLSRPLTLPCGVVLPNRIAKAAMSEQLGRRGQVPGERLVRLYRRWDRGGAGLLITGNVMVDRRSMESHRNVALEAGDSLTPFVAWARACERTPLWMQLNHPGRQCPRYIDPAPVAPSAVDSVALLRTVGAFAAARALEPREIEAIIERFATSARLAREAGFAGVQIHGAHGYLVSQFLSPRTNLRRDEWGGNLTKRARFLRAIVRAVRERVGADFPISVKLNSADFLRGGFSHADSLRVLTMLEADGVDLVEISGGSYESAAMFGLGDQAPEREAYFLEHARRARAAASVPLMVTGGFRTRAVMEAALRADELDVVGLARPFADDPDVASGLRSGRVERAGPHLGWLGPRVGPAAEAALCASQLELIARGHEPTGARGRLKTLALAAIKAPLHLTRPRS